MHSKTFTALLLAAAPLSAVAADDAVAQLTRIHGHVLLSTGHSMASATEPVRLAPGIRVLPTATSSAEITFDDGCRVTVGPGERYEVERESPCRAVLTTSSESREKEARQ
jgi:hypothetical protein